MRKTVNIRDENGNVTAGEIIYKDEQKIHPSGEMFRFAHDAETGALLYEDHYSRYRDTWCFADQVIEHFYKTGEDISPKLWDITILDHRGNEYMSYQFECIKYEDAEKDATAQVLSFQQEKKKVFSFEVFRATTSSSGSSSYREGDVFLPTAQERLRY